MIGLAITSVLLAYFSWKYIEKPFRARKVIKRKIVFAFSIIGSIFFICIGVVGYMNSGFPKRSGFEKFSVIQYETNKLGYVKCEDSLVKEGSELNYCHRTNRRGVTAALIGDSHADDKFYGIEKNDLNRGWMFIGNSSCPPVLGISVEGDQKGCKEKFEKIIKFVAENKDINTVVLSFYGHYSLTTSYAADHIAKKVGPDTVKISSETMLGASRGDVFYFGLSQTVKKLLNADKKVVVLVDIPELPYFPNDCLKGRPNCQLVLGEVLERQSEHRNLLERLKSEFPSINIFDPIDIFCQNNYCGYKINEIILYRDSHHLTLGGSDYYGGAFVDWLDKTIR